MGGDTGKILGVALPMAAMVAAPFLAPLLLPAAAGAAGVGAGAGALGTMAPGLASGTGIAAAYPLFGGATEAALPAAAGAAQPSAAWSALQTIGKYVHPTFSFPGPKQETPTMAAAPFPSMPSTQTPVPWQMPQMVPIHRAEDPTMASLLALLSRRA